jgi:hypothetical protein
MASGGGEEGSLRDEVRNRCIQLPVQLCVLMLKLGG